MKDQYADTATVAESSETCPTERIGKRSAPINVTRTKGLGDMHNAIARAAADRLQSRMLNTDAPVAVFVSCGSWIATVTNTTSYKEHCRKTPDRLMGIYTLDANINDVADDFYHSGVR